MSDPATQPDPTSPAPRRFNRRLAILSMIGAMFGGAGAFLLMNHLQIRPTVQRNETRDPVAASQAEHPWSAPMSQPGLPNLFRVSNLLYRGARPEAGGLESLVRLGVRTDINLESFHSERNDAERLGLRYVHVRFNAWHPEDEDVVLFLRTVGDPTQGPFYVHCQHGSDRTGMMVAIYRIVIQGWNREQAITEMTRGGTGFHETWQNLIGYLRAMDVDKLRRAAGLPATQPR